MKKQVIDINAVKSISPIFRGKTGSWLAKQAMRLFTIDRINKVYEHLCNYNGADFAARLLNDLGVYYQIGNVERLRQLPEGAFITISNHPYGGLDGIMLIDLMAGIRSDYKLMVNNILSLVDTMNENFISVKPITKKSGPCASNLKSLRYTITYLQEGHPVGFFPAGAVYNFVLKKMRLEDREWQENIIKIIKNAKVPIIPIRFLDRNSSFFYFLGFISWRFRSLRLPYEVFNKSKQKPRIAIGNILSVEEQNKFEDIKSFGAFLRKSVYEMPKPTSFTPRVILDMKGEKIYN